MAMPTYIPRSRSSASVVAEKIFSKNDRDNIRRFTSDCCCCQISTFISGLLAFMNLASFVMKIPFIILIGRIVYEQIHSKLNPPVKPTTETPYEPQVDPDQQAVAEQLRKSAVINGLFFLALFLSVLVIQFICFMHFWKKRKTSTSSCKDLLILACYVLIMTVWLLISFSSMVIQEWKYYLSLTFLLFKTIIHGNDLFDAPPNIEITVFRITFWLDLGAYMLTVIHLVMAKNEEGNPNEDIEIQKSCNQLIDEMKQLEKDVDLLA